MFTFFCSRDCVKTMACVIARRSLPKQSRFSYQLMRSPRRFAPRDDSFKAFYTSSHPKESEPKEKGALRKWSRLMSGSSRSLLKKAILIFGDLLSAEEIPKIAFVEITEFCVKGTGLHFRKGLFSSHKVSHKSPN